MAVICCQFIKPNGRRKLAAYWSKSVPGFGDGFYFWYLCYIFPLLVRILLINNNFSSPNLILESTGSGKHLHNFR